MKGLLQGIFRTMGGCARRGLTVYLHCSFFVILKFVATESSSACMREIHGVFFFNFLTKTCGQHKGGLLVAVNFCLFSRYVSSLAKNPSRNDYKHLLLYFGGHTISGNRMTPKA